MRSAHVTSPLTFVEVDRLRTALHDGARDDLYAIVDGARDRRIHALLTSAQLPFASLYAGRLAPPLERAAPYLVRLDRSAVFTLDLLAHGWGRSWGLFADSTASFDETLHHLRTLVRVQVPGGDRLLFRYYDPRVLRVYLPTCTRGEAGELFGPLARIRCEAETRDAFLDFTVGAEVHCRRVVWREEAPC
jgi:hypothetical protein